MGFIRDIDDKLQSMDQFKEESVPTDINVSGNQVGSLRFPNPTLGNAGNLTKAPAAKRRSEMYWKYSAEKGFSHQTSRYNQD